MFTPLVTQLMLLNYSHNAKKMLNMLCVENTFR